MLKENEKRTFWIVVMAIATVSLVTSLVSAFIVNVDYWIDVPPHLGISYDDANFAFSIDFLMLAFLVIVVVAVVMNICIRGKNSLVVKLICASIIGGYFLLSSIIFTIVHYVGYIGEYYALMEYITITLAIAISYEIAFLAQCMLNKRESNE